MDNPLLQPSAVPIDYTAITLENMREAFDHVLQAHERGIEHIIIDQQALPTWDDLVLAVDGLDAQLLGVLYGASPLLGRGPDWAQAILGFLAVMALWSLMFFCYCSEPASSRWKTCARAPEFSFS